MKKLIVFLLFLFLSFPVVGRMGISEADVEKIYNREVYLKSGGGDVRILLDDFILILTFKKYRVVEIWGSWKNRVEIRTAEQLMKKLEKIGIIKFEKYGGQNLHKNFTISKGGEIVKVFDPGNDSPVYSILTINFFDRSFNQWIQPPLPINVDDYLNGTREMPK